jgi:ribbon-helix-helix CopG family protein
MRSVKRLQIMIEEDLDAALGREAAREKTSKAALIRRYVRERLEPLPPLEEDPLWEMVGADPDAEPVDDIDEVVYGGKLRDRP